MANAYGEFATTNEVNFSDMQISEQSVHEEATQTVDAFVGEHIISELEPVFCEKINRPKSYAQNGNMTELVSYSDTSKDLQTGATSEDTNTVHDDDIPGCELRVKQKITLEDARLGMSKVISYLEANPDTADIYIPILKVVLYRLGGSGEDVEDDNTMSLTDLYAEDIDENGSVGMSSIPADGGTDALLSYSTGTNGNDGPDKAGEKVLLSEKVKVELTDTSIDESRENDKDKKEYTCSVCEKSFKSKSAFTKHMKIHSLEFGNNLYTCSYCSKGFAQRGNLRVHERIHTGDKPYQCALLSSSTEMNGTNEPDKAGDEQLLSEKVKVEITESSIDESLEYNTYQIKIDTDISKSVAVDAVKSNKSFKCTICGKGFLTENKLKHHELIHSRPIQYTCSTCNKGFVRKNLHTKHMKRHDVEENQEKKNTEVFVCPNCNRSYSSESKMRSHQRVHIEYKCSVCQKNIKSRGAFVNHMKMHALGDNPYTCSFCGKGFTKGGNLIIHERIHTGDKPYKCATCEKSFKSNGELCNHTLSMHDSRPKKLCCSICDKGFRLPYYLNIHMLSHTGERPYACHICGKTFRTSPDHLSHLKIHTGDIICKVCDKSFISQGKLDRHMRCHTGERPYVCNTCGKHFSQAHGLQGHMRTHTGEKPYACTMCDKRCADRSNLKSHMKVHGINREKQSSKPISARHKASAGTSSSVN